MGGINSYVNVFSRGKWIDEGESLKFGKVNSFPSEILDPYQRRLAKIIARECPRGRAFRSLGFTGTINKSATTSMALRFGSVARYEAYSLKKIFPHVDRSPRKDYTDDDGIIDCLKPATSPYQKFSVVNEILERALRDEPSPNWKRVKSPALRKINDAARNSYSALAGYERLDSKYSGLGKLSKLIEAFIFEPEGLDKRPKSAIEGDFEGVYCIKPVNNGEGIWAATRVFEAEKDLNLSILEVRDYTISMIGTAPRRMSRLVTDGKIFHRVVPEVGASILIDGSGSMGMSIDTIRKMVETAPASVIAIYYGGDGIIPHSGVDHDGGFIVVIARDGLACSNIGPYILGGANECDGIALRWLGQQPGPRYWVSDGGVTGPGDVMSKRTREDAAWCLRQFDIKWVNTIDPRGLVEILKEDLKNHGEVLI